MRLWTNLGSVRCFIWKNQTCRGIVSHEGTRNQFVKSCLCPLPSALKLFIVFYHCHEMFSIVGINSPMILKKKVAEDVNCLICFLWCCCVYLFIYLFIYIFLQTVFRVFHCDTVAYKVSSGVTQLYGEIRAILDLSVSLARKLLFWLVK